MIFGAQPDKNKTINKELSSAGFFCMQLVSLRMYPKILAT
jgi:hypothetical protein